MTNTVTTTAAGTGIAVVDDNTGYSSRVPGVVLISPTTGLPYSASSGGSSGGSSDTTEATQLAVKTAVQSLDAKTPAAGAAQPVSAVALPLPAGAATAAKQDTAAASLSSIDGKTPAATGTITTLLNAVTATGAGASATPGARTFGIIAWGTTTSGAGAATVAIQASHDNATWVTLATISLTLGTTAAGDAFGSPVPYKYIRANVTALSGTGAAVTATMGV